MICVCVILGSLHVNMRHERREEVENRDRGERRACSKWKSVARWALMQTCVAAPYSWYANSHLRIVSQRSSTGSRACGAQAAGRLAESASRNGVVQARMAHSARQLSSSVRSPPTGRPACVRREQRGRARGAAAARNRLLLAW